MKIKTTVTFKLRRLSRYTRKIVPDKEKRSLRDLTILYRIFYRDRIEKEIFNSCLVLKNLAIVHRDMPMSADFILEQLMISSKLLKNTFADMLSAYRNGRGEEAFEILYERVPVKSARHYTSILKKLDKINPAELAVHMTAFEETFEGERVTKGMKRAEKKSIITTLIATASIFIILLNFTVVVVFMDAIAMISGIF